MAGAAGVSSAAGASVLGLSSDSFASPAGSASPPSDEVQRVRLSRRSCMMSVLSR